MVIAVPVSMVSPAEKTFIPRAFRSGQQTSFQAALNTTSFHSVILQLEKVHNSLEAQLGNEQPLPLDIVDKGCSLNSSFGRADDGTLLNCTAACADPSQMFNSSFTFWNCLTLGAASLYASSRGLQVDSGELASVGQQMGFTGLDAFNGSQIFQNTIRCIKGSCQDYTLGSCTDSTTSLNITGSSDQVQALFNGLNGYCDGANNFANSDITGPGVVLSYVLQAAIAIGVSLLVNLFTGWLQPMLSLLYTVQDRVSGRSSGPARLGGEKTAWKRARERQRAVARSRPAAALASALVEFQEVQGFFVASIQVATLIIFASSDQSAMLSIANSFNEAVLNAEAAQMLAVNGVLPVLLTQIGLRRLGVRWWYMTNIVVLDFILAIVIGHRNLMPAFDTLWNYFAETGPIDGCGGRPSPMTYCLNSLDGLNRSLTQLNNGLSVGCLTVAVLVLDQMWHSANRNSALSKRLDRWEVSNSRVLFARRRIWPAFIWFLWTSLEAVLTIFVGMYLEAVLRLFQGEGTSTSSWTYGQLVAVMVWAPVIGKYVYFNIFGISEAVGKRLPDQYRVVEVQDADDGDGGGGDSGGRGQHEQGIELAYRGSDAFETLQALDAFRIKTLAEHSARQMTFDSTASTVQSPSSFGGDEFGRRGHPLNGYFKVGEAGDMSSISLGGDVDADKLRRV